MKSQFYKKDLHHFGKYFWLFTVLLILAAGPSALAQSRKDLEKQRKQLQNEIKEINSLLFQSQKKEKNLLSDLNDLDKRIRVRNRLIKTIDEETRQLNMEITENKKEISNLEDHLEVLKKEYAKMVVQSYKSKTKQNRWMFVLSSENFLQAYKRIQYIKQYTDYRAKQGEEIKTETIKLKNLNDLLEEKKLTKEQLISENKREKDSINNEKISQEKLVKKVKRKEKEYIALINKKQKQERDIDAKIEKLIRDAIAKSNKKGNIKSSGFSLTPEAKLTEKGFVANKGKLPAPVQRGVIVRHFGPQKHERLSGITIESNGLQYATEKGANARVIYDGKVLAIQLLPGNKKAVLIQHGNYISVYKNLDNVTVNKGDIVKTKQNIGKIHTDKTTGKTILAFVLFKEINRQNPEEWIYKI